MSKLSELLRALIDGTEVEIIPTTKTQTYLVACINGTGSEGLPEPTTVLGGLLCELADKLAGGGGGGGSTALKVIECDERGYVTKAKFNAPTIPKRFFDANGITTSGDVITPQSAFLLKEIELAEGITEIGDMAFNLQRNLTEITIPSTVVYVSDAFKQSGVKKVYFKGKPTKGTYPISTQAFYGCSNVEFFLPWGEGKVVGYPWGASNATVHYNWTPEE